MWRMFISTHLTPLYNTPHIPTHYYFIYKSISCITCGRIIFIKVYTGPISYHRLPIRQGMRDESELFSIVI